VTNSTSELTHILLRQVFRNDNLFNAKGTNAGMRNMTQVDAEAEAGDSPFKLLNAMLRYFRLDQMLHAIYCYIYCSTVLHMKFEVRSTRHSWKTFDGSRLISVVLTAYFEPRNRDSTGGFSCYNMLSDD
jgi:hypothetical protein